MKISKQKIIQEKLNLEKRKMFLQMKTSFKSTTYKDKTKYSKKHRSENKVKWEE